MALIELRDASVWLDGCEILQSLSWQLQRGAHCAVVGPNGAGKSTFLRLVAGRIWPRPHTSRIYDFGNGPTWSPLRARPKIALLSPEIQERYVQKLGDGPDNERGWRLNAREAILAGLFDSELLHQKPSREQEARAEEILAALKIENLAPRPLQTLSQGEMRRVLLARALISRPEVLLLDEACSGLDAASRFEMLALIENLARSGETTLVMTTHRDEEIVSGIREVFRLGSVNNGETSARETSPDPSFVWRGVERATGFTPPRCSSEMETGRVCSPLQTKEGSGEVSRAEVSALAPLIQLQNVSVFLDGAPILFDLDWELHTGQHFAIEGANGAGKTTFLRLLRGELHPARGGTIARFGTAKLQSRAAIGRKISLLSPATQARYAAEISVEDAVASGFFDSFGVWEKLSDKMRRQTAQVIELCGLKPFAGRSFARLSYGQRRRVLLARALVTSPQILLLDEALDGLDAAARDEFHAILSHVAARGASLVVVSHHQNDYPPFLTHRLRLENGKIAGCSE